MEGMNHVRIKYIHTWKRHNETLHRNLQQQQQKVGLFFSKTEDRKVKQLLSRGWYQWEGGGDKERVQEGEYGRNAVQSCMKNETC
jgi:hypothetical protein